VAQPDSESAVTSQDHKPREPASAPGDTAMAHSEARWPNGDPVDEAFTMALSEASRAQQWDVVRQLLAERSAHREQQADNVVALPTRRRKPGGR
jgi:hypothetical protein